MTITEAPERTLRDDPYDPEVRRAVLLRAAEIQEEHGYGAGGGAMPCEKEWAGPTCLLGSIALARVNLGARPPFSSRTGISHLADVEDAYGRSAEYLGVHEEAAYQWSDYQAPKRYASREVARVLREMADGTSWERATRWETR